MSEALNILAGKGNLSDRLRPNVECAPWAIAEVRKLEIRLAKEMLAREALERNSTRYQWLRQRLLCADFCYGDDGRSVVVFEWPLNTEISANLDASIDAILNKEAAQLAHTAVAPQAKRCEACRSAGMVHCSEPEYCGGPWSDAIEDAPKSDPEPTTVPEKKHWADKPVLRHLFWFLVLPDSLKRFLEKKNQNLGGWHE